MKSGSGFSIVAAHAIGMVAFVLFAVTAASCTKARDPVKIGFIGNLTGSFSDWGIAARDGFLLGVEQINRDGGIKGRPIEVVIRNDTFSPQLAAQAAGELADMGVVAIVGPTISETALNVLAVCNARKLLMISPSASSALLSGLDDAFFRVCQADDIYFRLLTSYLYAQRRMRRMHIVHDARNKAYSESGAQLFKSFFESLGGSADIVATITETTDFGDLARRVASQPRADGLFIMAEAIDKAVACQHIRKTMPDATIVIYGVEPGFIHYGGAGVEGVIAVDTGLSENNPHLLNQRFLSQYESRFGGHKVQQGAVYGYDAALVLKSALARTSSWTLESLKRVIIEQRRFEGSSGPFSIDANGDARRTARIITIRNGKLVEME